MGIGTAGILYAIGMKTDPSAFPVFFTSFLFLFAASGVGNASTFQMIPAIMRKEVARLEPGLTGADLVKQSDKESAAVIGFTSAVAAFGAFFIPKRPSRLGRHETRPHDAEEHSLTTENNQSGGATARRDQP
jgi:NNP family nitrate/nitrite transporter-like MFS transporter